MRIAQAGLFRAIKKDLEVLETVLLDAVQTKVPLVTEVGTHLVNSGGKRLRPALLLAAARGSRTYSRDYVMPLAAAVEMIHMASLVHDDVIDRADTRRGTPTANAKWGNQVAILSGDYFFAKAFSMISHQHYGEEVGIRLAQLVSELSVGEIEQDVMMFTAKQNMPDYYEHIEKKTADFLAICCELGAMIAGAEQSVSKGLYKYGHDIGMAFQITDDLLDITGDAKKLGKPAAGNDIRQGIVTLPIIRALETCDERDELTAILTNRQMTDEDVARALKIVRATDGVAFAKQKADEFLSGAKKALPLDMPQDIYHTFVAAADYIGKRDF